MQTPLHFGNKLFRTTSQQQRTSLCARTVFKDVEPLSTNLPLLELATGTEVLVLDVRTGGLDRTTDGLNNSLQVIVRNSTGTENVSVGKVLSSQITNR
jgi:hypothetical protein